jgi:hypothetical protein
MEFIGMKRTKWEESKEKRVQMIGYDEDNFDNLEIDTEIIEEIILESNEIVEE